MATNFRKDQCAFLRFSAPLLTRVPSSDVHPLELEAKSRLLATAVPFSESYKQTAKQILDYIHSLSEDSLTGVFKLKSDDITHIPFRLLNPGWSSTAAEESYVTASYCWSSPEGGQLLEDLSLTDKPEIPIQSYRLPVSPLLYQALLGERSSPLEGVWIDQICINQDSLTEKQIAVNAMDLIYKSARTVIILLDDITVSIAEQEFLASYIVDFEQFGGDISDLHQPHGDEWPPYMKANPVFRNFFLKLVSAKWFERAWCMHEMRLSPNHIFLLRCDEDLRLRNGLKSLPTVLRFTGLFIIHMMGLAIPSDLSTSRVRPLLEVFGDAIIKRLGGKREIPSYMRIFADTFRQIAGGNPALDPVAKGYDANLDKLSIVINTIGIGLSVTRAISDDAKTARTLPPATPDECCRRFITLAIAAADPSALCSTGAELQLGHHTRTWMRWPVYTDIGVSSNNMSKMGKFDVDFDPSPAAEYVGLDMYFFNGDGEGPRAGGIQWASERRLRICRAFKEGCELRKMYSVHYNMIYGEKLKRLEIRKAVIRTLAAIMECGIPWVHFMAEHVLPSWDRKVLVEAVQRLLDDEKINSIPGREREPFDTKYIESQDGRREAETLLDLARFLMHNSLPWDSEQSLAAYEPVCIVTGTSRSLMYAQIPDSGSNVDVVCATPTPLLQDEYSELFRGWTLIRGLTQKEKDDSGVWKWKYHLMGKSRIYGMVADVHRLDGEGSRSIRCGKEVKGVRIYGPADEAWGDHLAVYP
jgi:hypothetical protein